MDILYITNIMFIGYCTYCYLLLLIVTLSCLTLWLSAWTFNFL